MQKHIPDGQRTKVIYTLIKQLKYTQVFLHYQAINYLSYQIQFCPHSRAMSLLAYCYYITQDYSNAARVYQQLVRYYPDVTDYRLFLAQSYYKNNMYQDALKATQQIKDPEYEDRLILLMALIRYEKDQIQHAKSLLSQGNPDDPDILINQGCILFKQGKYQQARQKFQQAQNKTGYNCQLSYNIALCYYKMKQLAPSLKCIAQIIEKGVRQHPQLGVGSYSPDVNVKSVGNSQALKQTALIEAFNLKAAIQYSIKNYAAAREALMDMPPREQSELDAVTLMNQALMRIDENPNQGFKKLNHLLVNPPTPPETFPNLLLLYCKFEYYDVAADVLAQNSDLTYKVFNQQDFQYIDALILSKAAPEEAYRKFEVLANRYIDQLRQLTKNIQDARLTRDNEGIKKSLKQFDQCLQRYIPILMSQAKLYWDKQNYQAVQKLFRQSAQFCADHEVWKLNVAHVFFVLDSKYRQAIRYYEPIVKKAQENLLNLTAIVIANLCVSYIMINMNQQAEQIMKKVQKQQEKASYQDPDKSIYHLCIVNIVIGTLYCAKSNYEFGIGRIIKALEPYNKKINTDTWFYAKRCFLSLIDNLAKHMLVLKDLTYSQIIDFLDMAIQHGRRIPTKIDPLQTLDERHTVAYEARQLKRMFLKLRK